MAFDPVNDPQRVQGIWFGGPMSENAKQGLRDLATRFPESQKFLWVMPRRRSGDTGKQEYDRLMAEYQQEAESTGFEIRNAYKEADWLAGNLDQSKFDGQTIRDIYTLEMGNQGFIAAKDLTAMLINSRETSLTLDLSHRHMREGELEAAKNHREYNAEAAAPIEYDKAELKVIDLSQGQRVLMRNPMQTDFLPHGQKFPEADMEPSFTPHLDVNGFYSQVGTKGQEVMTAGAEAWLSNYANMVQAADKGNFITFAEQSGPKRLVPETISIDRADPTDPNYQRDRDNWLSAKFNTQDPDREQVIGYMAVNSLSDAIHMVYGEPSHEPHPDNTVMPTRTVSDQVWKDITMQAYDVNGLRVIPGLNLTKDAQNSWRERDKPEDPQNLHTQVVKDGVQQSLLAGNKMTVLHATNLGVQQAQQRGDTSGLQDPVKFVLADRRPATTGNSPNQTPPRLPSPNMNQLAADVAGMQIPNSDTVAQNSEVVQAAAMVRSTSAPANNNAGGRAQ
ncbi:hypothetical protein AB0D74_26240 [Streptomyces sp. NPDC048278]|uniref:hypothetical protein n=1 Tax=Streptomyces sp. NPDC048278 TaxID=3155809 RepID=UPI00341D8E73